MTDILVARGGFADDTALLRLHHAAGLSTRTVEANLAAITDDQFDGGRRSRPVAVMFAAGTANLLVDPTVSGALTQLSHERPDIAFIAVLDPEHEGDAVSRSVARVELLDAGADEVISFDVAPHELAARVSAVVRRVRRTRGDVEPRHEGAERSAPSPARPRIDDGRRELVGRQSRTPLTAKEATLMSVLVSTQGVVDRDELGAKLWPGTWCGTAKAIDMHVANLRRKLVLTSGEQWRIETVRGVGFVLVDTAEAAVSVTG